MKRILFIAVAAIFAVSAMAQSTSEIISRYNKVSGVDKVTKERSVLIDMTLEGQGQKIPMKMIKGNGNQFRVETSMAGMDLTVVSDGTNAWVKTAEGVQKLPAEAAAEIADQGDVVGSLTLDSTIFNFVYQGEKDGQYILKATPKEGANVKALKGVVSVIHYFDVKTGQMTKAESVVDKEGAEFNVVSDCSNWKTFGDVTMPTTLMISINGEIGIKMSLSNFELDYPIAAWMFTEPK